MRRNLPSAAVAAFAATALTLGLSAAPAGAQSADVIQPWLAETLSETALDAAVPVMVHGDDLDAARAAASAAGLTALTDLERIGVAVALGTPDQVRAVAEEPGVSYVEGDRPLDFTLDTSHEATRGAEAIDGDSPLTGEGVSVAVIDTGVDPTHPFFREEDGSSAVVKNLKNVCLVVEADPELCMLDAGMADTDTLSVGGHGTHVNGIVAGRPTELDDGTVVHGAAPGAKLVSLSVGAGLSVIGANLAYEWVLDNHAAPCGADVSAEDCPPIKAVNNSYGATGDFDPAEASAKIQRELAAEGVVSVWAQGNDGGDGSVNSGNPNAQDPTPGILGVASYYDQDSGTLDGAVSEFSSRGDALRAETWPDVSAPGEDITSSCRPYLVICATGLDPRNGPGPLDLGAFNTISGTSMASPHIAGIVAQLFQAAPNASAADIEHAIKSTAHRYSDGAPYESVDGYQTSYDKGTGLVDVVAAAESL
ncbi:MAG: S8 family peptidase [Stackebrandtia sp.]